VWKWKPSNSGTFLAAVRQAVSKEILKNSFCRFVAAFIGYGKLSEEEADAEVLSLLEQGAARAQTATFTQTHTVNRSRKAP